MAKRTPQSRKRVPADQRPPQLDDARIGAGGKVDAYAIVAQARAAREDGLDEEQAQELRRLRFELQHDLDKRLDKYLTDRITFLSRTQLQDLIDAGQVTVNAKPAKASLKVNAGDVIEVVVPPPPAKDIVPEDIPLDVMYEDEHLIVINKQSDIIVHPARSENTGTMLSALAYHLRFRSTLGGHLSEVGKEFARPGVVHRLDRDTTGCIVFAKTDEAHWKLGRQFEARTVDKRYLALVHGHVEPDVQVIDLPIGPHQSREKGYREKYVVRHDELGKASVTIVRVRERYVLDAERGGTRGRENAKSLPAAASLPRPVIPPIPRPSSGWSLPTLPARVALGVANLSPFEADMTRFSLVELELKTGRTHQIRVHLSHNLWPIVGDDMYGGKALEESAFGIGHSASVGKGSGAGASVSGKSAARRASSRVPNAESRIPRSPMRAGDSQPAPAPRQLLHACLLSFAHPITGKPLRFEAPLPADFASAISRLRAASGRGLEPVDANGATVDLTRVVR